MNKATDLRHYLLRRVPDLAQDPERLLTFIDNGKVEFWPADNLDHVLRMPLRIIITDFKGHPDSLIIPVLEWINAKEEGFDAQNGLSFESEIIDSETIDIMLSIKINELVKVRDNDQGGYQIEHVIPPDPPAPDAPALSFTVQLESAHD